MKTTKRPKRLPRKGIKQLPAIVLGLFVVGAAFLIAARPERVESVAPKAEVKIVAEADMVLLPVPQRNVARGEKLAAVPFSELRWPKERIAGNYILDLAQYKESLAVTPLPALLPVPLSAVSSEELDDNAVVEGIPEGMRAITVKVDAESAVEGWAGSGNYVDVILIRASSESGGDLQAKVIAQNVKILSAGRSAKPSSASSSAPQTPSTVTLLTSQEDALAIKAAASLGRLTFALRSQDDERPTAVTMVNQRHVLGGPTVQIRNDKPENFKGYARGPDGKLYVLADDSRWIRSADAPNRMKPAETSTDKETVEAEKSAATENEAPQS